MFDVELITQLTELMVDKDLREIDLKDGENRIQLKRGSAGEPVQTVLAAPAPVPVAAPALGAPSQAAPAAAPLAEEEDPDAGLVPISSPMVGTFYTASDPDTPPFVTVGSSVGDDSVVCIIEAMKVFNEIKAEATGTVERILVQNEQPVEFGQPMFMVRPS